MVTSIQIVAEECILFGAWLCLVLATDQIAIMVPDPAHTPVHLKFASQNSYRNAGAAKLAGWSIGNVLGAAKAALSQQIIDLTGFVADEMCENFPLQLTLKIRARRWSR
ncbi:hypothetical protein D3C72_2085560 [compost metagenome]